MYTFGPHVVFVFSKVGGEAFRGSHRVFAHMAHIHTQPTDCCTGMTKVRTQ